MSCAKYGVALALSVLCACAVGPDFKPPAPPAGPGFVPTDRRVAATAASPLPGGEAQRFVDGLDIPGQWWTLFQSPELNALIERALKHNPTLEAAQAALRQANENVAAQRGALYPSASATYEAQRNKATLAAFGLPGSGAYIYTLNSASVNVSYTLDAFGGVRRQIEALQAQADHQQFALEASYLTLTANVVTAAIAEASRSACSSTSQSGASPPAALRAPTSCSKRRRCNRLLRACRRCAASSRSSAICLQPTWARCRPTIAGRNFISTHCVCPRICR